MEPSILLFGMNPKAFDSSKFDSVGAAFKEFADELGADADRAITVRSNGQKVDASTRPQPGATYAVSIALGDKGA